MFSFELDKQRLRKALQRASRLEEAQDFFCPTRAVRNSLKNADDALLKGTITRPGPEGYRELQEELQRYGTHWKDTKAAYANAVALAIWELTRRATGRAPTFGDIAVVAAAAGFHPPKTNWTVEEIVDRFAKGMRSYCATTCERKLAVRGDTARRELLPGEEVGIRDILHQSLDAE